jgi:pantothenate kinase
MASTPESLTPDQALQRLAACLQRPGRRIIGLVGPPGAGKSTLSARIVAHFGTQAQVVPMDGYHLANSELERLGRRGRKGAPDTFDAWGYVALLQRLRQQAADEVVYAPEYRRTLEEPIAGAIAIAPDTRLLIAEGNYLGLDTGAWGHIAPLLDELWYVEVDDALRRQRLTARHVQFGRSPEDAARWVEVTDEPNARLIASTRARTQCVLRLDD